MRKPRLIRGGEVDFKLRRRAAWLVRLGKTTRPSRRSRPKLFTGPERIYRRRSVIKASYTRNFRGRQWRSGLMEAHARYLERDHGFEKGHKELGFDATEARVDISQTARNWTLAKDRLHWRLILSPDDVERIDLRQHTREVMAQMEKDLDTTLKWVAIEHTNTPHRHVHIFLRGVRLNEYDRDGKCLTLAMPREYVSYGIREISETLIERELGPRTEREYLEARSHGIEAQRWTEIDRTIERKADLGIADYSYVPWVTSERTKARIDQEMERLAFLEGMGLAQSLGENRWELRPDFKQELLDLQQSNDRIKGRAKVHALQREQELERELA